MLVRRLFAIKGEVRAGMSDPDQPGRPLMPSQLDTAILFLSIGRGWPNGGAERIVKEEMFEIREQQLLMLLLMIESKGEQIRVALQDERHSR